LSDKSQSKIEKKILLKLQRLQTFNKVFTQNTDAPLTFIEPMKAQLVFDDPINNMECTIPFKKIGCLV